MALLTEDAIDEMVYSLMAEYNSPSRIPTEKPTFATSSSPSPDYHPRAISSYYVIANSASEAKAKWDDLNLKMLISNACMFQRPQYFGPDYAQVFCISPSGGVSDHNKLSSGYSLIGLKVNNTIRLVTTKDPICKRTAANKRQIYPYNLMKIALVEMIGVQSDDPFKSQIMLPDVKDNSCMPVAVVSVAPSAGVGYPNMDEILNARRTVEFLFEKLKDHCPKSSQETEKVAVCALSVLLGQEFYRHKIMLCGWGDGENGEPKDLNKEVVVEAINTGF